MWLKPFVWIKWRYNRKLVLWCYALHELANLTTIVNAFGENLIRIQFRYKKHEITLQNRKLDIILIFHGHQYNVTLRSERHLLQFQSACCNRSATSFACSSGKGFFPSHDSWNSFHTTIKEFVQSFLSLSFFNALRYCQS